MALISIPLFGGMVKAVSAKRLKEQLATLAVNARVDSGQLAPLKGLTDVATLNLPSPTSLFRYQEDKWFEWTEDVDVAKTPVPYDVTDLVAYTGDSYPRITRNDIALGAGRLPVASYRLGIPAPSSAALVVETTGSSDPDVLEESRHYIYTYVDAWGREGAPSLASAELLTKEGSTVTITMEATPSGNYNFGTGALRRVYRSNTGSSSTAYQFLGEVPMTNTIFVDTLYNDALGEVIPSITWDGPPDDDSATYPAGPLVGLCALPSGVLAGFTGKTLCFSEAYLPHAWPVGYRYPVSDSIRAVIPALGGVVVLTDAKPVLFIGGSPEAMAPTEIDEFQACPSKRSAVDMGESVIYASPNGLIRIAGNSAENLTEALFTADQWAAYNPEQLRAFRFENKYVAFHDTGGFIFTPGSDINTAFIELDFTADGGYHDPDENVLYLLVGGEVKSFDTGANLTYTWRSKTFHSGKSVAYSCAKIDAPAYPVSLRVISSGLYGTTTDTYTAADPRPFVLADREGTEWTLEIIGSATIDAVALATSMPELADV